MKKFVLLPILLCLFTEISFAQHKKVVAIMPFLSSHADNRPHAAQLQSIVSQVFTSRPYVQFVDRSTDAIVLKELENQTREQSISSETLVEQGKLTGSQEIIIGNLASISVEQRRAGSNSSDVKYIANISYSLQVVDAATGILKSSGDINGSTKLQEIGTVLLSGIKNVLVKNDDSRRDNRALENASSILLADTKDEAIRKAIAATKQEMIDWIRKAYPPVIMLLSVETRDKTGLPETVIITGPGLSSGKKIIIREVSFVNDSEGNPHKREKKIGELKVSEIQGDVIVCKVTDGENILDEKMKSGAQLEFALK